jgi:hypothetical protein
MEQSNNAAGHAYVTARKEQKENEEKLAKLEEYKKLQETSVDEFNSQQTQKFLDLKDWYDSNYGDSNKNIDEVIKDTESKIEQSKRAQTEIASSNLSSSSSFIINQSLSERKKGDTDAVAASRIASNALIL